MMAEAQVIKPPMSKTHKHKSSLFSYWAIIRLKNDQVYRYQLSKDIQAAMKIDGFATSYKLLKHALIVVPISEYGHDGHAKMTVGRIEDVFKGIYTHNSRWITRGQWISANHLQRNWLGILKLKPVVVYLQHDYDNLSQKRIKWAVKQLAKPIDD